MTKPTMASIFKLLERKNMCFPKGRTGLNDKVRYEEKINIIIKSEDGKVKEKQ